MTTKPENHLRGISLHSLKENFMHLFHHDREDGDEQANTSPLSSPTRKEEHSHRKSARSDKSNPYLKTASGTTLIKAKRDEIEEESHQSGNQNKKHEEENSKKTTSTVNLKISTTDEIKHQKKDEKDKEKDKDREKDSLSTSSSSSRSQLKSSSSANIKMKPLAENNNNNNNDNNININNNNNNNVQANGNNKEGGEDKELEDLELEFKALCLHDSSNCSNCPTNGLDAFERVKLIGRGDVGKVYLVRHKQTGKPYAMKVMSKSEMVQRRKIHRALTEREILISANFPLLVTMHYSFQNDRNLYFVMDYCAGGEFFRALQKQPNHCLPEPAAKFYACEVLMALEYLHLKGIVYRDLKPENILLQETGHIMLTDFNLSKQTNNVTAKVVKGVFDSYDRARVEIKPQLFATSLVGTEEYLAPELVKGCAHSQSIDWWTFGIFIYEMLYGVTPFKGKDREETFSLIKKSGIKFPKTPEVSSECKNLITKLLNVNPTKRLGSEHGASDVKSHPFFKDVKWALILNEPAPIVPELSNVFDTSNFREINEEMEDCSAVDLRTKLNDPFRELKDVERGTHERSLGRKSTPSLMTVSHPNIPLNVISHNNINNNNNNANNNNNSDHKKENNLSDHKKESNHSDHKKDNHSDHKKESSHPDHKKDNHSDHKKDNHSDHKKE